jgi:adenosylhomocysteine nucleosidase
LTIAIMAALEDEIRGIGALFRTGHTEVHGQRTYHIGRIGRQDVVLVLARIGKVAAASTATTLINRFSPDCILFTGVAGALAPDLDPGDLVIAKHLVQHDLDARPLFPRHEVPFLRQKYLPADPLLVEHLTQAARSFTSRIDTHIAPADLVTFNICSPKVRQGLVISGDQFINCEQTAAQLRCDLPDAQCVEMEGAAVAQVCFEHEIPCAVIRTISDNADGTAHVDFPAFTKKIAGAYATGIVGAFMRF